MNLLTRIVSDEFMYALGWTVIHSFWQALVVAVVMALLMLALQKYPARLRYLTANIALVTMFALSVLTFYKLYHPTKIALSDELTLIMGNGSLVLIQEQTPTPGVFQEVLWGFFAYFDQHIPLIVSVWMIGLGFFLLRLIGGLSYVQMLRHQRNSLLPQEWQDKMQQLARQIPVYRPVVLLESALVKVPMVIGYLKPAILLPIGTVNGLSGAQVEAILAHELAHIYRNDYLLNILQSLVETLFYFNPAVWWISANIRLERENCCDDIAVKLCGNNLIYAKALVSLQEMSQGAPSFAMTFANNKNQLLHRIRRILKQPQNKSTIMEKLAATSLLLIAIVYFSVQANPTTDKARNWINEDTFSIAQVDTIPALPRSGKMDISTTYNNEKVRAKVQNGEITHLEIDGKKIPESQYPDYENFVAELLANLPKPPAPPAPPAAPTPNAVPAPPAPPTPPTIGGVGTPPLPPAPPSFEFLSDLNFSNDGTFMWSDEDGSFFFSGDFPDTFPNMAAQMKKYEIEMKHHSEAMKKLEQEMEKKWDSQLTEEQRQKIETEIQRAMEAQERAMKLQKEHLAKAMEQEKLAMQQAREAIQHAPSGDNVTYFDATDGIINNDIKEVFATEFLKDGLIESKAKYSFQLSATSMKVNGKKQPQAILEKYKKLYAETTGKELLGDSRISVSVSSSSNVSEQ